MTSRINSSKTSAKTTKKTTKKTVKKEVSKGYSSSGGSSKKKIRANLDTASDPYIPKGHRKDYTICERCHIVYHLNRWYIDDKLYNALKNNPDINKVVCPACKKIEQNYPLGIVTIKGSFFKEHKDEILNLITHEAVKSREINPLERIIAQNPDKDDYIITTTSEKLAQKIGRALHKAYRGEVKYSWSEDNKFIRVFWERGE